MFVDPIIFRRPHEYKSGAKRIKRGIYISKDYNIDTILDEISNYDLQGTTDRHYPNFSDIPLCCIESYGIVDTPMQFYNNFYKELDELQIPLFVTMVHVPKSHNLRWHKWGTYYGDDIPTCEYLSDENGFNDGVYNYHIHVVDYIRTIPQVKVDIKSLPRSLTISVTAKQPRTNRLYLSYTYHSAVAKVNRLKRNVNNLKGKKRIEAEHSITTHNCHEAARNRRQRHKAVNTTKKENKPRYVWNRRKLRT